jgi:hypothetical protein
MPSGAEETRTPSKSLMLERTQALDLCLSKRRSVLMSLQIRPGSHPRPALCGD